MALRSINNRRRSSTAWSIEGVTSQGKDRACRSLAYNLGTIASDYHLAVLSDAVFEVVSLREVGDASIQNIVEKIASNPEEFYGSFATMKLRTNSSLFCSIPCASEKQFQDQLVSLGFSQGPWFADGRTYSTLAGNVVAGANPLDPATLQPAFVFVDHSNAVKGGDGATEGSTFFLSARAIECVQAAQLVLPARTVNVLQEGWTGTELSYDLEDIFSAFKDSVFNRMALAVMEVLFPHFYTLTSGLTSITPTQAFGSTIGQHVLCLYRHYDPNSVHAIGDSSDEITNLVLNNISTGQHFLSVTAGCSAVTQNDLRSSESLYEHPDLSLVGESLRVRMNAAMETSICSHAQALMMALKRLSDQQSSIILQRGMQTGNLILKLGQCAAAGSTPLNESIKILRCTLDRLPYPAFVRMLTSCSSALVADPSTLSISVFVDILASVNTKRTPSTNVVSHCSSAGSGSKRLKMSELHDTSGPSCATLKALDHFMLHAVADHPTYEEYTAAVYSVLSTDDANRSLLASKFCYAFISGTCNKGNECSFPHVPAEKISACIRAILASGGKLTPIYVPSNILQQLVTKDEMLHYFRLKKEVQMKAKSKRGFQGYQGGRPSAGENFQGSNRSNPTPVREQPIHLPLTPTAQPPSSLASETGIPLASSHPPPNCSTVTFSDFDSAWSLDSSAFYAALVGREGDPLKGLCYSISNDAITAKNSLETCTSPRARLIKTLFTWQDLRARDPIIACDTVSLPTHLVGVSNDLEPSVAIIKLDIHDACISPLACTASALPDSGANLTLANGSHFNPNGSLHHCVKFLVPLDPLGKFEVKGVDGSRSTIRSICWIEIPVMVRSNGASSDVPQIMIKMGFNAFLIDMNNPNAIIFGNKTLGALGCHIVPHFVSDNNRSPSSQLRPYENPLPFRLALHPFLEDAARKAILSESTSEEMKSTLSSLVRLNGTAPF